MTLLSILMLLLAIHCAKEDNTSIHTLAYDTAFPHLYFPAWPGSYWIYHTHDTLKALNFKLFTYNQADYTSMPDYDTVVAIRMKVKNIFNLPDTFAILKNNEISKPYGAPSRQKTFTPLFSTQKGIFYIGNAWQGHATVGECQTLDTTLAVNHHHFSRVLVCIWYDNLTAQMLGKDQAIYRREFWADGVGLIRRDEKPVPSGPVDFLTTLSLVDWHINNPVHKTSKSTCLIRF